MNISNASLYEAISPKTFYQCPLSQTIGSAREIYLIFLCLPGISLKVTDRRPSEFSRMQLYISTN